MEKDNMVRDKVQRRGHKMYVSKESGILVGVRKLVKYGSRGVAIGLPPEWCEKHGLKAGQEVPFIANGTLKLVPFKEEK